MEITNLLGMFRSLFTGSVWECAKVLLIGSILAPGKRTVSAILRVMGVAHLPNYQNYHRALNRAKWSSRQASLILMRHLNVVFIPTGRLILGLDDTIERRWGKHIAARGIYRDSVRSSQSHFVKVSGPRWLSLMMLVPIPWAKRTWALSFLTLLAPFQQYHQERHRPHKRLTDWARQMLVQVRRWQPMRPIMVVADISFAALELLWAVTHLEHPIHMVSRLRLDAELYQPAPLRRAKQMGRPRKVGERLAGLKSNQVNPQTYWQALVMTDWYGQGDYSLEIISGLAVWYRTGMPAVPIRWILILDPRGQFETQACTDVMVSPHDILQWFRWRWQVEVTFEEVRTHLGVETQRQ